MCICVRFFFFQATKVRFSLLAQEQANNNTSDDGVASSLQLQRSLLNKFGYDGDNAAGNQMTAIKQKFQAMLEEAYLPSIFERL